MKSFRHELKYVINSYQIEILKNNLKSIMKLDSNSKNEQGYFIRSLYFDDYKDTSYYQVVNGISKREKYRIRFYDMNKNYIVFEKKNKENNLGYKDQVVIKEKDIDNIFNGIYPSIYENDLKINYYKPKIIVDYYRLAYIYEPLNIRITIDSNISCSSNLNLFDDSINQIPILEKNKAILEVKYDDVLPYFIKQIIMINNLELTSFSKYANAREVIKKVR